MIDKSKIAEWEARINAADPSWKNWGETELEPEPHSIRAVRLENLSAPLAAVVINEYFVTWTDVHGGKCVEHFGDLSTRLFLGLLLETKARGMAFTIENLATTSQGFKVFIESERQNRSISTPSHVMTVINRIDDFLQSNTGV